MLKGKKMTNFIMNVLLLCCFSLIGILEVSGSINQIENFPYQVTVELDRKPICGGAIIGDHWVITANSCIPENLTDAYRVKIRAGSSVLSSGGAFHVVSKIIAFNSFMSFSGVSLEIGLIKVASPFIYSDNIRWASPDVEFLSENKTYLFSGWGIHQNSSEELLRSMSGTVLPHDQCVESFKGLLNITKEMSCLIPTESSESICNVDVGSPITDSGLITAIVSNNEYCGRKGLPVVVTNLANGGAFIVFSISEPIFRWKHGQ